MYTAVCMFVQGLVPNEREHRQLRIMYTPFLSIPLYNDETYDRINDQIYSGDDDIGNKSNIMS